jgi:FkbM family methyltransferase
MELIHRGWRYRRRVDPDGIRWMSDVLRPGDLVVDVGAYKGGYTYWMRRGVGEEGRVLAFEPQPEAASLLRRYVVAFAWQNVTVLEVALSSAPGERTLLRPGDGPSPAASLVGASLRPGARALPAKADTLDHCLAHLAPGSRLRLLKCDAEGHELDVFLGARDTLREHRPAILFECEARHLSGGSVEDVFAHLQGLGYRGRFFWQGESVDVARFDAGVHQVEGRRPYANNFAFVHGGSE